MRPLNTCMVSRLLVQVDVVALLLLGMDQRSTVLPSVLTISVNVVADASLLNQFDGFIHGSELAIIVISRTGYLSRLDDSIVVIHNRVSADASVRLEASVSVVVWSHSCSSWWVETGVRRTALYSTRPGKLHACLL